MESKDTKFRLRLNLFDGIVLVLAILVGGMLVWNRLKPQTAETTSTTASTVRYTICLQRVAQGTGDWVKAGEPLMDNIKNFDMGVVTGVESQPAVARNLDQINGRYVDKPVEGFEDLLVTVEAKGSVGKSGGVTLDGGYKLCVGAMAYVKGVGFFGSGPIVAIEREGQA